MLLIGTDDEHLVLEDKCVVFFVVFSATILILAHICGILTVGVSLSSNSRTSAKETSYS